MSAVAESNSALAGCKHINMCNVREWTHNSDDGGHRYILGGGWSDLPYAFNDAYALQQ
jgi:hypothetical protein